MNRGMENKWIWFSGWKRRLERTNRRWKGNNENDFKEIEWETVDLIHLHQEGQQGVSLVIRVCFLQMSVNFLILCVVCFLLGISPASEV